MPHSPAAPIVLTIAGSDSGGGAGIQADLKTFSALGTYGASVITALTAQNTRTVTMIEPASPTMIRAQIDAVFSDLDVRAVKLGMLGGVEAIRAVRDGLQQQAVPIVLDPVMIAKSGDRLLPDEALQCLMNEILPIATLITPNLPEAAALLGLEMAQGEEEIAAQADKLMALGAQAVLMKGGHAEGPVCLDLLAEKDARTLFEAKRQATRNTHGTGCTLSAAIAAGLAKGLALREAVSEAHSYLQGAIAAADQLSIGSGNGPVHHFHALWQQELPHG